MQKKPPLTAQEKENLALLLERVDSSEIRGEIWHQLVQKFITVSVIFCVLDKNGDVFLSYRKDREFDGYHLPGATVNDWETVDQARERLAQGELKRDAGIDIGETKPIGWVEASRGVGDNPTRHAVILMYLTYVQNNVSLPEGLGFFPLKQLPSNILGCEKRVLSFFQKYLSDGVYILGA